MTTSANIDSIAIALAATRPTRDPRHTLTSRRMDSASLGAWSDAVRAVREACATWEGFDRDRFDHLSNLTG